MDGAIAMLQEIIDTARMSDLVTGKTALSALHSAGMKVVKVDEAEKEKDGVDD